MRRGFSIVLMLVFGLAPLSPLVGGSEDGYLPACCRRHGAHHCAMNMAAMRAMMRPSRTPAFAAPLTCPYYPGAATAFSTPPPGLTAAAADVRGQAVQAYLAPDSPAAPNASPSRTHAGRGPPQENLC